MPFRLEKSKTGSTPYVLVDEERKYMKFQGECYHENVLEFFRDINTWLADYLENSLGELTFDCELQYFNSSTAKLLLNILLEMDERAVNGRKMTVNWITTEDNDIIIECGEDFREELGNLEFHMVLREGEIMR